MDYWHNMLAAAVISQPTEGGEDEPPDPDPDTPGGGGGGAPVMGNVTYPVDPGSVIVKLSLAMGVVLLLAIGLFIGFEIVRKLFRRVKASI